MDVSQTMSRLALTGMLLIFPSIGWAGSVFITGHDPDFHASNTAGTAVESLGAVHINQVGIDYILDPAFNTFKAGGVNQFLFVESNISPPAGHRKGVNGIIQSGFISGTHFEHHDATTLNAELNLLGTKYSGIVIASDFGGLLTQNELDILNSRSNDLLSFLNLGGGIFAMSESNGGDGLTPDGGHFGYLPFVVSTTGLNQNEAGTTLTPFGASLGLTNADVSSNFSHNIFEQTSGLNVVDRDSAGQILTLAGRGQFGKSGVVPEPSTIILLGTGLIGLVAWRKKQATT